MPKVMAQPTAGRPPRAAAACPTSLAEINVVPLVDVMLVLLIIFMVAAPMMQKGVEVNLPVARRAGQHQRGERCTSPCRSPTQGSSASPSTTRRFPSMCSPSACGRR